MNNKTAEPAWNWLYPFSNKILSSFSEAKEQNHNLCIEILTSNSTWNNISSLPRTKGPEHDQTLNTGYFSEVKGLGIWVLMLYYTPYHKWLICKALQLKHTLLVLPYTYPLPLIHKSLTEPQTREVYLSVSPFSLQADIVIKFFKIKFLTKILTSMLIG